MRKRLILISILLCAATGFSQTTTITGTIKDLSNTVVSSGKVVFTLKPSVDTTISGNARFTPGVPITCYIQSNGTLLNAAQNNPCVVATDTSLTPGGTSYRVDICPYMACSSSFNFYAINGSYDISTIVPTPTTGPAQNFADVFSNQVIAGNKTLTGNTAISGPAALTGSTTTCSLNGMPVLNPGCYLGSDIGAQINAAYAACPATGCHIKIPPGQYVQSTPILFATNNKPAWIDCDTGAAALLSGVTTLTYTPTTGIAVTFQTGTQQGYAISGCRLVGPGSGTLSIGILSGGCPTSLASYCAGGSQALVGATFSTIDVETFGYGVVIGNNHYLSRYDDLFLLNNGINISYPSGTSGSGEGLKFYGGVWAQKTGSNTPVSQNCVDWEGPFYIDFALTSVSHDNCPVLINPTPSTLITHILYDAGHFENPNGPLTSTGLSGGTQRDFIQMGSSCGNCNVSLVESDVLEDSVTTGRTDLISLGGGLLTLIGGDYRAAATVAQCVNGTATPNGLMVQNSTIANCTNWQGGSITASEICSMYGTPQCQFTGVPLWFSSYPFASLPTGHAGFNLYCSDCKPTTAASCSTATPASCVCAGSGSGMMAKYENFVGNGLNWYCH